MTVQCRTKKCNNTAISTSDLCRVCLDDLDDKMSPPVWDGHTKVSEHTPKRVFTVTCILCGRIDRELLLTVAQERQWAISETSSGCQVCGGFLILEDKSTGFMETIYHLRPPVGRSADLKSQL